MLVCTTSAPFPLLRNQLFFLLFAQETVVHFKLLDSGETDCNKLSINKITRARRKLVFEIQWLCNNLLVGYIWPLSQVHVACPCALPECGGSLLQCLVAYLPRVLWYYHKETLAKPTKDLFHLGCLSKGNVSLKEWKLLGEKLELFFKTCLQWLPRSSYFMNSWDGC